MAYVGGGVFDATTLAVTGDFTMAVLGLRWEMRFKLLDQAVITDATGAVIYNLAQQDMMAHERSPSGLPTPSPTRSPAATTAPPAPSRSPW